MSIRSSFAFFAAILSATSVFAATTTTNILLCATSNDATAAAANQAASGWTFSSPGAATQAKEGSYYYPVKFNSGTTATSSSVANGSHMTELVLGVKVSNVARTITVTPYNASGTIGTPQTIAPGASGSLVDVSFSFTATEAVSYVSVKIAGSGSATAYLYYATVTTETPSGGGVNTPPQAMQPSVDVDATVGTAAEVDLSDYFTDADGDPLTYALDTGVGAVSGSIWSFTPNAAGSFSAEVSATDPSGDSAPLYITVTAVLPPLSAPTFEPVHPEDATADGFVLRWLPIEGAVAYELSVTNAATGMGVGATVTFSIPSGPDPDYVVATVSDLESDTTYAVAARALATTDPSFPSTDYTDSDWSTPVEISTTLEGGLLRATLFDETFDRAGGNSWNRGSTAFDASLTDESGWVVGTIRRGPEGLLLGTASNPGSATTREIVVSNEIENATVVISFLAASYINETTTGTLTASNTVTGAETVLLNLTPDSMSNSATEPLAEGTSYEFDATVPARFALRFESLASASDKRLLLDSIKVTQVYDPNFAVLAAPAGVAESDVGKHGFTVSWTGVANATGYEVWLNGAYHGFCASTFTSMSLTGLSDRTTYSVQVKALGDNLHFGDSALSTAVSVTTLADAQKIDFTVTGAPTDDVFAGDAISFTVTAENEATHAAEPVSFPGGIAGATFNDATGAFSWTPTESDVGSHTATFTSGDYSTNVTIAVISALKTETLKAENFSEIKSSSWTSTSGYASELEGDMGLWTGLDIIKTKAAVIIGRAGSSGNAVSPAVELKVRTPGSLSVSFDTGSLSNKTASVKASILDAVDGRVLFEQTFASLASLPVDATAVSDAGAHFTLAPGSSVVLPAAVKVKFETIQTTGTDSQRAYVDTVVFAQTVSARIRDLTAPTGLAVVEGSVETNGFSVAWSAVSGATNYAVRVTDASGAVVFSAPFCAATQAAVTGLADDVVYGVQVRATGDEAICFASPWSDALAVRTARSPLHPTLTLGAWQNAVGDGKVYGGLANTAAVSAERDNGEAVAVTLDTVSPVPAAGPTLADGLLSWIPDDADTNKTFTISFLMDGTYATNLSVKVQPMEPLHAPDVTVGPVVWDSFGLAWNSQYRAAGYAVRVWTDCPNPAASATLVEERFPSYYKKGGGGNRPAGWLFHVTGVGYANDTAPVQFSKDGNWMATYNLGGPISSVTFYVKGNSMTDGSTLRAYWAGALSDAEMEDKDNWTNNLLVAVSDLGGHGQTVTAQVPAGADARRIAWLYEQHEGNIGVGQVSIEGEGFSTPRWLTGWGPAAKDVGLAQTCTVAKPRPGKVLGVDPANKKEDLTEPRPNYAEVTVRDAAGATLATVVEVDVPAPPRSARTTMLILR